MATEITPDLINEYISRGKRHDGYAKTTKLYRALKTHAHGEVPKELVEKRRPSESADIKKYRETIYVPKTKNPINKVITSLSKIRRSSDWNIAYDKEEFPKVVVANEALDNYCEERYPFYNSITNWIFSELLRGYLIDSNAVVAVVPLELPTQVTEYIKPFARLFWSDNVLEYKHDDFCILISDETCEYGSAQGLRKYTNGKVYYVITTTSVTKYKQTSSSGAYEVDYTYEHKLGYLPAYKVGGIYNSYVGNFPVYESRINAMVPDLDEAAREYSDLQAEVVQHIHSEKWVYLSTECPECNGVGKVKGTEEVCPRCKGVRYVPTSPYNNIVVTPQEIGSEKTGIPTPPAGYIQKDVEIVKIQDERVRNHIYNALSSINMEFLSETPLNQSGTAKEVDRDELNNFVNSIAEDIVGLMDKIYNSINDYRYSVVVPSSEQRKAMLPRISVPERFDLLSSNMVMQELANLKTANANPVIIRALEVEYAKKKFNTSPEVSYELQCVLELDPLPSLTNDDKMAMIASDGITQEDYIISCNIIQFVRRAIEEDKKFVNLSLDDKRKVMQKYAAEIVNSNSAKQKVIQSLSNGE